MATTDKDFKGGLAPTVLSATISATVPGVGQTFQVEDATGYPDGSDGSFVIRIDSEAILCSSRSGNIFTVEERHYDNTTAASHTGSSAVVKHTSDAATIKAHEKFISEGGTFGGPVSMGDEEFRRPLLLDYAEKVKAHGAMGTTETLDYSEGNWHTGTLDENVTITLSNAPASGRGASMLIQLTHDGSGGSTITWTNGTYVMAGGGDPTLSTTAGATLFFTALSIDGTNWFIFYAGSTA